MSETEIKTLLNLALLSPTAFNIQNWRFFLPQDKEMRKEIRAAAWDQAQVTDASLLVILCGNLKAWDEKPGRYWKNTSQEVQDFIVPAIGQYYDGNKQTQRDEVMRSCGIAAQTLMLAAKEMGYESCPMDGFDYDKVGEIIKLPDNHIICMFVAVGKGIKEAYPRGGQLPYEEVVKVNSWD